VNKLRNLLRLYRLYRKLDNIVKQKLSTEDVNNLSALFVDSKYKSLAKLIDNIIMDLENRMFKDAQKEEEFLAIKWTRAALFLLKGKVEEQYNYVTKPKKFTQNVPNEALENYPDGVPLNV